MEKQVLDFSQKSFEAHKKPQGKIEGRSKFNIRTRDDLEIVHHE
jgi:hypothetical protein